MKTVAVVALASFLLFEFVHGCGFSSGGGCGCCSCYGRKKRSIKQEEPLLTSSNASTLLCNDEDIRTVMLKNLKETENESKIAISQAIEEEGQRFLVVCAKVPSSLLSQEGLTQSDYVYSMPGDLRMCSVGNANHTCHAFEL